MRLINKTKKILRDNSGETMVEVIVAFTLLTVLLVTYAQGITSAANAEAAATKNRTSADEAMLALQEQLAAGTGGSGGGDFAVGDGTIRCYTYSAGGYTYVVYKPVA